MGATTGRRRGVISSAMIDLIDGYGSPTSLNGMMCQSGWLIHFTEGDRHNEVYGDRARSGNERIPGFMGWTEGHVLLRRALRRAQVACSFPICPVACMGWSCSTLIGWARKLEAMDTTVSLDGGPIVGNPYVTTNKTDASLCRCNLWAVGRQHALSSHGNLSKSELACRIARGGFIRRGVSQTIIFAGS